MPRKLTSRVQLRKKSMMAKFVGEHKKRLKNRTGMSVKIVRKPK